MPEPKTKPRWLYLLLLVSFALGTAFVVESPYPAATVDDGYNDSLRHLYSTWLFLRYGDEVFRRPLEELAARDRSSRGHTPWGNHPYIYPPGALAVYLPFALAEYGLGLPEKTVHQATVVFLLLIALASVAVFVRELSRMDGSPIVLPSLLYGAVAVQFSLNGIYDSAYVIPAVLGLAAARRGEATRGLMWLGVASFFHFRAIFYLPVAFALVLDVVSRGRWRRIQGRAALEVVTAAVTAAASVWVYWLVNRGFGLREHNALMDPSFGWGGVVAAVALTVLAVGALARGGDWMTAVTVGWMGVVSLVLPFTRAWHSLGLYPVVVLRRRPAAGRDWLLVWILLFGGLTFRHFPNLRWLARGLGSLFGVV